VVLELDPSVAWYTEDCAVDERIARHERYAALETAEQTEDEDHEFPVRVSSHHSDDGVDRLDDCKQALPNDVVDARLSERPTGHPGKYPGSLRKYQDATPRQL
jgi:hypothetical protein